METMDVLDVKGDRVFFLIASPWNYFQSQLTLTEMKMEEEMTASHHPDISIVPNTDSSKSEYLMKRDYPYISPFFPCYRTFEASYQTMEDLANQYPSLVDVISIGPTYLKSINEGGHEMKVLKLTNSMSSFESTKSHMFVICSLHAREITPAEVCARFAETMVNDFGVDSDTTWIMNHTEIHIILQANPDGREYEENHLFRYKRKNMNTPYCCKGTNGGVDLNRNFPHSKWTASDDFFGPCSQGWPGKAAASEKETQAIVNYMESIIPPGTNPVDPDSGAFTIDSSGVMMDIHSSGELFYWPYSSDSVALAPNKVDLFALGKKLASFTTPRYRSDNISPFENGARGVTTHYTYEQLGVPGYTIELGTAFYEKCDYFETYVLGSAKRSLFYLARVSKAPYQFPKGPEVMSISITQNDSTVEVNSIISDSERALGYSTGNQNIVSVELFLDSHPYDTNSTFYDQVSDNFNNSTSAEVIFNIPFIDLNSGQHILYLQAHDTGGPGPVYSAFFETSE